MSRAILKEDLELNQLREHEQQLLQLEKEAAEIPKRIAREQKERESMMPPLAEIEERKRLREHEDILSRGEAKNILRDQNKSLLLLVMLIAATGSLVWWGLKLMQG